MSLSRAIVAVVLAAAFSCLGGTELYDIRITLKVPRVFDNTMSTGYRRYQTQRLSGTLRVTTVDGEEPFVELIGLENRTHRVAGKRVSYSVAVSGVRWHAVGSNLTGVFKRASVKFDAEALPSYVPTFSPTDDETLVLTFSGGGSERKIEGTVSGSLGCGCSWYGHKSPTRIMWTDIVVDTASSWGRWRAKRIN